MPDLAAHYYFGQSVLAKLPEHLQIDKNIFDFALSGPDDWFYCFKDRNLSGRAPMMHRQKTGAFLRGLASEPATFSYFAGFFCHYALDAACHPYIISCTGTYDRTHATRQYRGNHTALERAIDRWILRQAGLAEDRIVCQERHPADAVALGDGRPADEIVWEERHPVDSVAPGEKHYAAAATKRDESKHPLTDVMFPGPLPAALEEPLNRIYQETYGWPQVFPELQMAKQRMYKYLRILEDPQNFAKLITTLVPHPLLRPLPYSRRYYESADILNLSHRTWHHPKDPSLTSTCSFPELMEAARKDAVLAITSAFRGDLSHIGNRSYITGLDLDDPRNQAPETYQLLPR